MTIRGIVLCALAVTIGGACGNGDDHQAQLAEDFAITMHRGICFGPCPVYQVAADASGRVIYRGEYFVREKLQRESHVTKAALLGLLSRLERINFFDLEDEYRYWGARCPQLISDAPTVTISVTRSGVTHQLHHYHGCLGDPVVDDLTEMELEIDRTLGTREWVFCSENDSFFETSCEDPFG